MNNLIRFIPLQSFTNVLSTRAHYVFCNLLTHLESKEVLYFGKNTKANIEISIDHDYNDKYISESIEIRNTILANNVPTFKNANNYLIYEKINLNLNTFYGFKIGVKYNLDIMTHEKHTNEIINKNIVNIDSHEIKFEKNNYPILLNLEEYHSSEVLELLDYVKRETLKV
jgi:hypothetical protein